MTVKTWGILDKQRSQIRFLLTSIFTSRCLWSMFSLRNIWVFLFLDVLCSMAIAQLWVVFPVLCLPQSPRSVKIYSNPRPCPAPPRQHQWCTCPQQLGTLFQSALPAHTPQTLAMYVALWRSLVHIMWICVSLSRCSFSQEKYPKAQRLRDFPFSSQLHAF